jgi:uncharacterized coiled-coil DUF342 family protein
MCATVDAQLQKLMSKNDELAAERDRLHAQVSHASQALCYCQCTLNNLWAFKLPPTHTTHCQVQEQEIKAVDAEAVQSATKEQVEALHAERGALQEEAQRLADALMESELQMQALAERNGELRCMCHASWAAKVSLMKFCVSSTCEQH